MAVWLRANLLLELAEVPPRPRSVANWLPTNRPALSLRPTKPVPKSVLTAVAPASVLIFVLPLTPAVLPKTELPFRLLAVAPAALLELPPLPWLPNKLRVCAAAGSENTNSPTTVLESFFR